MKSPALPVPGQRWISDSEPELGLGIIRSADDATVTIEFPAAGEQRRYARRSAPLRRVRFQTGDRIRTAGGESIVVSLTEVSGLIHYRTETGEIREDELSGAMSFSKPEDRLRAGRVDEDSLFRLRLEALLRRAKMRQSPVHGFAGGRVDLLPHQMYIAAETASRLTPRVLLADEVGLGKTIEAGLILHRLHLTGRAARVLILVPEPLVHQWFVELLRRFNLLFSIFDEERCYSIERLDREANPFHDSQLVLCSLPFLTNSAGPSAEERQPRDRAAQAVAAGWDLVIVDEAHHLEWSPEGAGPGYRLVEQLAAASPGVLLLTATPEQLGPEGHYARLRLLDPDRYPSLAEFREESARYGAVAEALRRLESGKPLSAADQALFTARSEKLRSLCEAAAAGGRPEAAALAAAILDAFGPGRVMFRNSRRALAGFPERQAHLTPVEAGGEIKWLAGLLRALPDEKFLLICRSQALAGEIHAALLTEIQINAGLFHEGMTLLQRDRSAAWFASEDGARILICSEIGSEGRNFQFAHHLVLYDLPENPELLEQRIGRLDRIGQTATIHIHVPFVPGSPGEVLALWYHEGLDAFRTTLHGAAELTAAVGSDLQTLLTECAGDPAALTETAVLVARTRELRDQLERRLAGGCDFLLERNSCRPDKAEEIIAPVRESDSDLKFEAFVIRLLDHFGMEIEEHSERSYILRPGNLLTDSLPDIPEEGLTVTFNRTKALSRDDLTFLTADHPLVRGALDLLLGGETGNAAFVIRTTGAESLLLEAIFVVECIAPAALHADRFLPATAVRVVVDHRLHDCSADRSLLKAAVQPGEPAFLASPGPLRDQLLPAMLTKARALAGTKSTGMIDAARRAAAEKLGSEISRMTALSELNDHVRPGEMQDLREHEAALAAAIGDARLRLDSVRLVRCQ